MSDTLTNEEVQERLVLLRAPGRSPSMGRSKAGAEIMTSYAALRARVRELEQAVEQHDRIKTKLEIRIQDLTSQCSALTQAHQQAATERDELRNLQGQPQCWKVEHMNMEAQLQQAVEALANLLSAVGQYKDAVKQRHERHDLKGDVQIYFRSAEQNLEDYEAVAQAALATHKEKG